MKLSYKRGTWEVEMKGKIAKIGGKTYLITNPKLFHSEEAMAKSAVDLHLKTHGTEATKRYEAYLKRNRRYCSEWRKKNRSKIKAYRQRPHIKAYRRTYIREYMRDYRKRVRKEAGHA